MGQRSMPPGLSRAYLLALAPSAFLAPLPLLWTHGSSRSAILLYEVILLFLWYRARVERPVRVSDGWLNVLGLGYLGWLGFEMATLRLGLLRSVSHLLLFTAIAKLASLKRPSEARLALLVIFLLTLASASSSTHVSSLVYFAAMAWLGFRTLGRLAVLADFSDAPPDRVLASVPTMGMSAVAIVGAAACTVPLFFALPRLHGPFAVAPVRLEDAFSQAQTSDRVDLESFGAAKRSDRVILRLAARPALPAGDSLRLREADFTRYQDGAWLREPGAGPRRGAHSAFAEGGTPAAVMTVELNAIGRGFLFLPYGTSAIRLDRGRAIERSDGVMQISGRGPVRYELDMVRRTPRGAGRGVLSAVDVPREVQEYAVELTGDLTDPRAMYRRIEEHLQKDFVYTLDPPRAQGDPIVHFLKRSKAGHCEYFASAAAMMLAARGVPARLVTGSYGGEEGLFARTILVRADNLHAWVEADLDGTGFQVLDPHAALGRSSAAAVVLAAVAPRVARQGDRVLLRPPRPRLRLGRPGGRGRDRARDDLGGGDLADGLAVGRGGAGHRPERRPAARHGRAGVPADAPSGRRFRRASCGPRGARVHLRCAGCSRSAAGSCRTRFLPRRWRVSSAGRCRPAPATRAPSSRSTPRARSAASSRGRRRGAS